MKLLKLKIMKRLFIIPVFVFAAIFTTAQGVSPYSLRNLRVGFEINSDIWLNTPDSISLKNINRGVNIYIMYQHKFGKSNFGVAGGLSVATQNMYLKDAYLQTIDGVSAFQKIPSGVTFKKNKLNLNFFEIPLEFNYKTKGHINFAIGGKAGFLMSDKTKYKGKDFENNTANDINKKVHKNPNIMNYRLGAYALVGYKWINLTACYGFTNLFEKDMGPEMSPLTIGVMVRPY